MADTQLQFVKLWFSLSVIMLIDLVIIHTYTTERARRTK